MDNREWKGKSRGGAVGNLIFVLMIKYLGVRCAYMLLLLIVPYFVIFAPKATAAMWDFYHRRLRYNILKSAISIPFHFYRFGQVLIDKTAMAMGLADRYSFDFENYDEFLEILNSDKGAMVIGAHIGNWECGAPFFGKYGKKMNIVMLEAEHEKIKKVFEENSHSVGYKIIPLGNDIISSMIEIKCALNNNEYVCMQGDRFMNQAEGGSAHTITRKFIGHDALFPQGPFMLAKKLKVPTVFYFALRNGHKKYMFRFTPAGEGDLADQYVALLERTVMEYPSQWFNFYKFW